MGERKTGKREVGKRGRGNYMDGERRGGKRNKRRTRLQFKARKSTYQRFKKNDNN